MQLHKRFPNDVRLSAALADVSFLPSAGRKLSAASVNKFTAMLDSTHHYVETFNYKQLCLRLYSYCRR